MAILTALGAITTALGGAAGTGLATGLSAVGTATAIAGQVQASRASAEAERIRKRQMLQESARRQREIFRQSMLARATAVTNATSSGVGLDSSAFGGAIGQIAGEVGRQSTALSENTQNSLDLFSANATQAQGESLAATGRGLSNLGSTIVGLKPEFQRIGETLYANDPKSWKTTTVLG